MSVLFMYHSVYETVENPWLQIRPSSLAEQLDRVRELGYRWTPLREAIAKPHEKLAALTFDDGFRDFLPAFETIRARSIPVIQYICPGLLGKTSAWMSSPAHRNQPLLDADELRGLVREGLEIGCHGWTHTRFPEIPIGRLREELGRCVDGIEHELGTRCESLAYPYGLCDRARAEVVGEFFSVALAVEPIPDLPTRLALPRLCGTEGMGRQELAERLAEYELSRWLPADALSTPA